MIDERKLWGFVAVQVHAIHEQLQEDYRGAESAPYSRYSSPMSRYQPMIKLLDDRDLRCLRLSKAGLKAKRKQRRSVYNEYVDDLGRVVESLLLEHAESGCVTLDVLREEATAARLCIRQLRCHARRHWLGFGGVPDLVATSIRDLTAALHLGELVVMPLPAQAIA